jgi:type IV secretion system protein VirB6
MQTILDIAANALDSGGALQHIKQMMSALSAASNLFFFSAINDFLNEAIAKFADGLLGRTMKFVGSVSVVLMTIWITIQGYRIVTGQSRDSMAALVMNSLKATLIVGIATGWAIGGGSSIFKFLGTDVQQDITKVVTGSSRDAYENIDRSLGYMQLAFTSIDSLQDGDSTIANDQKNRALWFTGIGTGGPAITAGVMLLLNKIALALFTGLGPIFILCLLFEQTKQLFGRWLFYGIGTMFSLAVLSVMVGIALDVVIAVAGSFWVNSFLGGSNEGVNSMAMQQGGLGLVLTMLIISAPPMAASFFQGTMGSFLAFSQFGGSAGTQQNARGPGSAPTNSTYASNSSAPGNSARPSDVGQGVGRYAGAGGTVLNTAQATGNAANASQDVIRSASNLPANYQYNPQSVAAERALGGPVTPNNTASVAPAPNPASAAPSGAPLPPKGGNSNPTG